jgi:phospholipase/lecithinase/hemolysin
MRVPPLLASAALLLALAACGGGGGSGSGPFSRMVVFGDSMSDAGTYAVGTVAAQGGGRWTINTGAKDNWTELLAQTLQLPAPCAAETGLQPNAAGITGAAVTDHPTCFNYAQGSARVTNPLVTRSVAVQGPPINQVNIGLLAKPVAAQVSAHLARTGGRFAPTELVTVLAGGNDAFTNLSAVMAAAGGGATASGSAFIAGWDAGVQTAVAAGGAPAVTAATNAALAAMATAGTELATLVKTQVVAKGASYVMVANLRDLSQTPFGLSLSAGDQSLLRSLVASFNTQLQSGLAGTTVVLVDANALQTAEVNQPATYGLTNVTSAACNPALPANALAGLALACTASTLTVADASGFLFSDTVHPSPTGYRALAQAFLDRMFAVGWLSSGSFDPGALSDGP